MSSSGTTESSTPISGGCCGGDGDGDGGMTSSATDKTVKDDAVDSSPFQVGEQVLAYHGPCLYNAKVQKVEFHPVDGWRCYVHYPGWNKHWDEWLDVDWLLKPTEKNVQKQKELMEKHAGDKHAKPISQNKNKGVRGKKRKHASNEKDYIVPSEKLMNIQIPSTLKNQLVDDHECITHLGQLVKLPRSPSVYDILDKYFEYRVKKDGSILEPVGEIMKGLRSYFDKALPAMLLYKQERQQYNQVITNNISPSCVYGAEHLLRLFVKLPEMLSCLHIEMGTLTEMQTRLQDFLRFLQSNQSTFFHSTYHNSEGHTEAVVKEEDD